MTQFPTSIKFILFALRTEFIEGEGASPFYHGEKESALFITVLVVLSPCLDYVSNKILVH